MNTCPKCGSPQESPKLDGTTARIWFTCGSYGYADKPDQVFRSSDKCLDREEINDLQRKVEELQAQLDNLQASTIHSCGDSCSRPMCVLRRERDAYKEALEMNAFWDQQRGLREQEEAERAMQKFKKMEGEANVPLEENEGLHEDIIFWLTRAANWTAIAVRMAEELRGYESLALTHPHLYQGKGALLEFDRLKEKMK